MTSTATGRREPAGVPLPSWPSPLDPQAYTRPAESCATMKSSPTAMCRTIFPARSLAVETITGAGRYASPRLAPSAP